MANIILCLGGNAARNQTAATVASREQDSIVLVSSEGSPKEVSSIYNVLNVDIARVFYDFHAWDTLTNFTETYKWILSKNPKKITVVTDDFHVKRSMRIGNIVYAFRCISLVSVAHPSSRQSEADSLIRWDTWRATVWRTTGKIIENGDRNSRMISIRAAEQEALALGLQII